MANRFQDQHSGARNYDLSKSDAPGKNALSAFFGPPSAPLDSTQMGGARADDRYPHETFNLPKAYEGKNKYLETQIWWMLNQAEFLVDKLCPWELTDQLSVEWEIWKFNNTMADYEPEQGVPRYVTSEQESHRDALSRRGLAFIIEHGFFKTKRGQETYMMNLRQIVDAIHTTVYYGVLTSLLNGKNHYKEWERKFGDQALQLEDIMRKEVNDWAIAQKTERGLYVLDAHLKHRMKAEGIVPNIWVFPPKMQIFLTMYPSSEVVYNVHGPGNQDNLEKGPANMLTFRGSQVHEASPIDVDFVGKSHDLLSRDRMIGSYFTMFDTVPLVGASDKRYSSGQRSIFVYDASADDFRKISLQKAIFSCMRFDNSDEGVLHDRIYDESVIAGLGEKAPRHGDFFTIRCPVQRRWRNAASFGELFMYNQIDPAVWRATVRSLARILDVTRIAAGAAGAGNGVAIAADNYRDYVAAALGLVAADFVVNIEGTCGQPAAVGGVAGVAGAVGQYPRGADKAGEDAAREAESAGGRRRMKKKRKKGTVGVNNTNAEADNVPPEDRVEAGAAPAGLAAGDIGEVGGVATRTQLGRDAAMNAGVAAAEGGNLGGADGIWRLGVALHALRRLKITRKTLTQLVRNDVRLPFGFLLLRPFQRYQASSAILAQGGKDLGITFHGHHDFQLTDDVIHKTHVGHYTFYSKTVIKNPNRYVIAEDVFCTKYCGGENTTFFTRVEQFEDVATGSAPSERSLLSVIVPADRYGLDGSDLIKNPLDITGRFDPAYTKNLISPDDAPHYPGAGLLTRLLDLTRVDWGDANDDRFNALYQQLNRICFQGRQFAFDWKTQSFAVETLESGHWGRSGTYAGCRAAREGRGMLVMPDRESTLL